MFPVTTSMHQLMSSEYFVGYSYKANRPWLGISIFCFTETTSPFHPEALLPSSKYKSSILHRDAEFHWLQHFYIPVCKHLVSSNACEPICRFDIYCMEKVTCKWTHAISAYLSSALSNGRLIRKLTMNHHCFLSNCTAGKAQYLSCKSSLCPTCPPQKFIDGAISKVPFFICSYTSLISHHCWGQILVPTSCTVISEDISLEHYPWIIPHSCMSNEVLRLYFVAVWTGDHSQGVLYREFAPTWALEF